MENKFNNVLQAVAAAKQARESFKDDEAKNRLTAFAAILTRVVEEATKDKKFIATGEYRFALEGGDKETVEYQIPMFLAFASEHGINLSRYFPDGWQGNDLKHEWFDLTLKEDKIEAPKEIIVPEVDEITISNGVRSILDDAAGSGDNSFIAKTPAERRRNMTVVDLLPSKEVVQKRIKALSQEAVQLVYDVLSKYSSDLYKNGAISLKMSALDADRIDLNDTSLSVLRNVCRRCKLSLHADVYFDNEDNEPTYILTIGFIDEEGFMSNLVADEIYEKSAEKFVKACDSGLFKGKIWTVHDKFNGLNFDMPFRNAVESYLESHGLDEDYFTVTEPIVVDGRDELGYSIEPITD